MTPEDRAEVQRIVKDATNTRECRSERLLVALRLIASQNCASKSGVKEMVATMRKIAREAISRDALEG